MMTDSAWMYAIWDKWIEISSMSISCISIIACNVCFKKSRVVEVAYWNVVVLANLNESVDPQFLIWVKCASSIYIGCW